MLRMSICCMRNKMQPAQNMLSVPFGMFCMDGHLPPKVLQLEALLSMMTHLQSLKLLSDG